MTTDISDPIAALPPFISVKQTCKVLNLSRATVWRRIKDGTLQVASGTGRGRKNLIIKASIERFAQPAQVKP
jgi:excisionase family DNA binding protein